MINIYIRGTSLIAFAASTPTLEIIMLNTIKGLESSTSDSVLHLIMLISFN